MPEAGTPAEQAELAYLRSPRAIRERTEALYALARAGKLQHFALDETRLTYVTERVLQVTRSEYPDVQRIPYHGRYRHFDVGGVPRLSAFDRKIAQLSAAEQVMARTELVITSVLLDAGAGADWSYRGADGGSYSRSEGLAVASYDWFASGGLSTDPNAPWRADTERLERVTPADVAAAFQVRTDNPLVGVEGRAALLQKLGRAVRARPELFGEEPRLGGLALHLLRQADGGSLPATAILRGVIEGLGEIWPGRETLCGQNLGDVFRHSAVGRVPFHKLSQWLTYSLCEPLEAAGVTLTGLSELTGLAEYRNGGLFLDAGVLVPKHAAVLTEAHAVHSEVVVEWRGLTLPLLDRTAAELRKQLGLTEEQLPLAKVLEGGTWRAGRVLAREQRADGGPPLRIVSDGTVF